MRAEVMKMKGKYVVLVILFLLFIPSVHAGNWNSYDHDLHNTASTTDNGPEPPLKVYEKYSIGDDWLTPIVHNNIAYIVRNGWRNHHLFIIALNLTNEKILWKYKGNERAATYAFYLNGNIYVDSRYGGIIEAINASTGQLKWSVETNKCLSNNVIYEDGKLYFLEEDVKNKTTLVVVNAENGKIIEKKVILNVLEFEDTYILLKNNVLYVYYGGTLINSSSYVGGLVYAVNTKNGSILWNYTVKNWYSYFEMAPFTMGEGNIYIPVRLNHSYCAGIQAINTTTGKLMWSRMTDYPWFGGFTYHFAYSPQYHMIVRSSFINHSLYLIAFDSRDGHNLWERNITKYNKGWLFDWPSIAMANNYIYMYVESSNWGYSNPSQGRCQLRLYSIDNGSLAYYVNLWTGDVDPCEEDLDLPQMAVVNGTVIIPDYSLYIIVHGNSQPSIQNNAITYAGISVAAIGVIVASVIIVRKRNGKTHGDMLK